MIYFIIVFSFLVTGFIFIDIGYAQSEGQIPEEDVLVTSEDLVLLFSVSILILIGIIIYMTREVIFKKKTKYETEDLDSKKNRDYEKYHSDWHDDSYQPGTEYKKKFDREFQEAIEDKTLPNYYNILGIQASATQDQIKNRFRELVKEYHPDRSKDELAEKKMAEINKAYEVLSDGERRQKYDKYLNLP